MATAEPNSYLLTFYYYYSYFTLAGSWLIAPILFYAILTKSKVMGKFKWLVFNYSFWSLCFTTLIGIVKPLFFFPGVVGIQYGALRHVGDYRWTLVQSILCLAFIGNCFVGLCSTLAYRYLLVFPTKFKDWFTFNRAILLTIVLPTVGYAMIIFLYIPLSHTPLEEIQAWGAEYNLGMERYFGEQTFFALPRSKAKFCCFIALLCISLGYALIIGILIIFLNQIQTFKSKILTKIGNGMIMSSLVQIAITCVLFMTPNVICFTIVALQIQNTASISVVAFCFFSTHCLLDFISTMYFITPYRKFVVGFLERKFRSKSTATGNTSVVVTSFIPVRNRALTLPTLYSKSW